MTLWAGDVLSQTTRPYAAAWYRKTDLTFTDAIGAIRLILVEEDGKPYEIEDLEFRNDNFIYIDLNEDGWPYK